MVLRHLVLRPRAYNCAKRNKSVNVQMQVLKIGCLSNSFPRRSERAQITPEEAIPEHRVRLEVGEVHGSSGFSDSGGWSQTTVIWCLRPVLLAFKGPCASSRQRQQHWLFQSIPPAVAAVAFLWYTLLYYSKHTNYLEVLYSKDEYSMDFS